MFENKKSSEVIVNINENKNLKKAKSMLNKLFDFEIKCIRNYEILKLNEIAEYKFELEKLEVELIDNTIVELYLKIINKMRIKESLFCYYKLILENKEIKNNSNNHLKRLSIKELNNYENRKSVQLNDVCKNKKNMEVHFIDESELEEKNIEIAINEKEMLFAGIIK